MSAFEKTDDDGVATGGARPIAMGETIRRWVTRAIVQQKSDELEAALAPCQYAVGVASGSEKLIAAVRTFLSAGEADERRVLLSLDAKNAFNTMSRQAILEGVNRLFPDLTQYFLQWYGEPAELWFHHERGYTCKVSSEEGVQQGDSGGPAWYACGLHGVLEKIRTALPGRLVVAFADNIYIGTAQDNVAHDFDVAETELASVRQALVREKCEVWGEHFTKGMDRPADMPTDVCVRDEGLLVLGCPFGTSEFMERHFAKVLKKTQHLIDNLPQLEDPQSAEKLLRFCATPKFHYHLRTSLPFTRPLAEAAGKHSRALIQTACTLFSLGDIQTKTVRQLKLPLTEGGFGLTDAGSIAPAAYFGAGAVVLADVLARHEGAAWMPAHGRAGLEAQPWVQAIQAAYDHLLTHYPPSPQSDPLPDVRSLMLRPVGGLQSKLTQRIHKQESASLQAALDAMRDADGHPTTDGARLQSCKGPGASGWIQALPSSPATTISPDAFVWNVHFQLGLAKGPTTCGACTKPCDPQGDHMLKCPNLAHPTHRHNTVQATVYRICKEARCPTVKKEQLLRDYQCPLPQTTDKQRMDLVITQHDGSKIMADITGTHPTHADRPGDPRTLTNQRPGSALRLAENRKRDKYAVACARGGYTFLPLAFESYGRWSPTMETFLHKLGKAVKDTHYRNDRDFSTGRVVARWWVLLSCAVRRECALTVRGKSEAAAPFICPFPRDEVWGGAPIPPSRPFTRHTVTSLHRCVVCVCV